MQPRQRSRSRRPDQRQPWLPGLNTPGIAPAEFYLHCARWRLALMTAGLALLGLLLVGRLSVVSLSPLWQEKSINVGAVPREERQNILDRNGYVLATSLPTVSLCLDTKIVPDLRTTLRLLQEIIPDLNRSKLEQEAKQGSRCLMVKRHLPPMQQQAINALGLPGLEFLHDTRRLYPSANLTAHVVGYTDIDGKGLAGLEQSQEKTLRLGQAPLRTTLDIRLQQIIHDELQSTIQKFQAIGGVGLLMDISNGEVLSLVSLPDFDPHQAGRASDNAKFNRATLGVYELGSVFKLLTVAAALDKKTIKLSDSFDATHALQVGRFRIADFRGQNRWLNLPETLIHSSNIATARIGMTVGGQQLRNFFGSLGLLQTAKFELPELGSPLVPPLPWRDTSTMTISFGHGVAVAPIQLLASIATIGGTGQLVTPHLLQRLPQNRPQIISEATANTMRGLMRLIVTEGTAKTADAGGFMVGGKTGTAEKIRAGGGYNKDARISSFVGMFPMHAPRYALFVMVDEPKGIAETFGFATGGWVAAPAAGRMIAALTPLLGIAPMNEKDQSMAESVIFKSIQSMAANIRAANDKTTAHRANQPNRAPEPIAQPADLPPDLLETVTPPHAATTTALIP